MNPSLAGEWEVLDHVLSVNFDKATAFQPFTGGKVSSRPIDIDVRLELVQKNEGRLLLRLPNNNLTLAAAELLDGAGEKSFVRCAHLS